MFFFSIQDDGPETSLEELCPEAVGENCQRPKCQGQTNHDGSYSGEWTLDIKSFKSRYQCNNVCLPKQYFYSKKVSKQVIIKHILSVSILQCNLSIITI